MGRFVWIVVSALALAAIGGGYLLGRSGGEDLDRARSEGREAGQRAGAARGAERGYELGLGAGRREAFRRSYREARARTLRERRGEIAVAPTHRSCGDLVSEGAGSYGVESTNLICDIAVQVARQWEMECAATPEGDCTVNAGFYCDYTQTGYELGSITCTEGDRRVTFETGA